MKTKAIRFVGVAIVALILTLIPCIMQAQSSGGGGSGGSVGSALPIQSQDVIREFALANVVRGARYVNAASMDWNWSGSRTYVEVSANGAENVLDKLFAEELVYRLTNPDDKVQGYVYLYDKFNTLLFFGYAEYTAADLKKGKPQYNIWMQNIPLLSNVSSAEVLALDEDGKTGRHYSLDVDQYGRILFPPWMAGSPNGILVVRFTDGSVLTYDLAHPVGEVPSKTFETAAWKIDGHYYYRGLAEKPLTVKIIEIWQLPTALIEVRKGEIVTFDVMGIVQMDGTTTFERPMSMVFTQDGGPWAGAANMNQDKPFQTSFPADGKYRTRFEWKNFGKPGTLYSGPDGGVTVVGPAGGKG